VNVAHTNADGLERLGSCKNKRRDSGEVADTSREFGEANTAGHVDSEALYGDLSKRIRESGFSVDIGLI
jgi:hypothetical protein